MKVTTTRHLLLAGMFALILLGGMVPNVALAANEPKVEVCHRPPDNPTNFQTIRIPPDHLQGHLVHGDIEGACNAACAVLCDDGDQCTIDDTGDCETNGCPTVPAQIDCSDGNACTADACISRLGCAHREAVTCVPPDRCTASVCAPGTGACVTTPIVCPAGSTCDLATGDCKVEGAPDPECAGQSCGNFTTCNAGGSCGADGVCASTFEGGGLCINRHTRCRGLTYCYRAGSSECNPGEICIVDSCCGLGVCVPGSQYCSNVEADFTPDPLQREPLGTTIGDPRD
jgi:hypothetical protein